MLVTILVDTGKEKKHYTAVINDQQDITNVLWDVRTDLKKELYKNDTSCGSEQ